MKTIQVSVFYFILIALTISCKNSKDYQPVESTAETVIIAGNISNSISNMNTVTVYVNDIVSGNQLTYVSLLDSAGNFKFQFKQYIPQDVLLRYGDDAFPVFVHPKDSINVNFDARLIDKKMELAKTIRFSGSASELNSKLIVFSSQICQIGIPWEKYCQYEKEYSTGKFVKLLDSLKSVREIVMNRFIKEYNPSEELKIWIKYDVEMDYLNSLARYPSELGRLKNLDYHLVVPLSFYDCLNISLPYDALINSRSIDFIGRYNFSRESALMVEHGVLYKQGTMWIYKGRSSSNEIKTICKYTKDSLLQEMLISQVLYDILDRYEIKDFEKNLSVFESKVHKPFLREPIINKYVATKRNLEKTEIPLTAALENLQSVSTKDLMTKIIQDNKEKVICLDIWSTFCAPCREEMPLSQKLDEKLNNSNVAFVYLCVDSEENKWKAIISEMGLKGKHYLATPESKQIPV